MLTITVASWPQSHLDLYARQIHEQSEEFGKYKTMLEMKEALEANLKDSLQAANDQVRTFTQVMRTLTELTRTPGAGPPREARQGRRGSEEGDPYLTRCNPN